jgi:hypothetical protein
MMSQYLLPLVMMGAFGAYAFWMMQKRKAAMANLGPALRNFFERTGYRYSDIAHAPVDEQVRAAEAKIQQMSSGRGGNFEMDLVRDFHGATIRHHQYSGADPGGAANVYVMSCSWRLAHDQPAKTRFQAAAKSLSSIGKAVRETFGNTKRQWEAAYPHKVESGDAELDKAFVFYGDDPEAVKRALAYPGLKEAMLGVQELDLQAGSEGVSFSDPMQKNLRAGMGGTLGAMAVGFDYGKLFDLTIPVHDQIAELLALAARASQA